MLVYIYTRVSSEEQARDGVSLSMQESSCRELAARTWGPDAAVRLFCDDGYSAETLLRPALQEMLDALAEADVLVIWRQDRLLRHPRHMEGMMEMCADAGVRIVSTQGEVAWGNASERAFTRVRAVFSGLEVEQMAERIQSSLQHVAESGRHPCGSVYGYDRQDGHLVINAERSAIVREVYRRYADGESMSSIARDLQARGVPTRRSGYCWTPIAIKGLLQNPTYIGLVPWNRDNPSGVLPGTHEALVSRELWERVQALLRERARNHGQSVRHMSTLFSCGLCGGPIGCRCTGERCVLLCQRRIPLPREEQHAWVGHDERKAAAVVWRHTELLLTSGELRDALAARRDLARMERREDAAVHAELRDLDERRRRNLQAYQAGVITLDDLTAENSPLVARDAELRAQLQSVGDVPQEVADLGALRPGAARRLVATLRAESVEAQVAFLSRLYETVVLYPDRCVLRFAGGLLEDAEHNLRFWYTGPDRVGF